MNSLISYPPEGAKINIMDTSFEYFSTCGSIIKNKRRSPYDNGSRLIQATTDSFASTVAQLEAFKLHPPSQIESNNYSSAGYFNPFTDAQCSVDNSECHSVTLHNVDFKDFDIFFFTNPPSNTILNPGAQRATLQFHKYTPEGVQTSMKKYRGAIFELEDYHGSFSVASSSF